MDTVEKVTQYSTAHNPPLEQRWILSHILVYYELILIAPLKYS